MITEVIPEKTERVVVEPLRFRLELDLEEMQALNFIIGQQMNGPYINHFYETTSNALSHAGASKGWQVFQHDSAKRIVKKGG